MSGKVNDLNKDISNNADLEESYDSKKANKYMKEAIKQAKKAASIGEVPIGCVIVYQDKIIGRGYNRRMVDEEGNEFPHYYCNLHNPDAETYPPDPDVPFTPIKPDPGTDPTPGDDDIIDDPDDPNYNPTPSE